MTAWRKSSHSSHNGACAEISTWRKSTYSTYNGNCAEIGAWRKSSKSNNLELACIEAGQGKSVVGVRDTKQAHLGDGRTVLEFSPAAWAEFTQKVRAGVLPRE